MAQHASKWNVVQSISGISADQTSFLTAPEAEYAIEANGEKVYRNKLRRSFHPVRFISPIETMRYPGISVPLNDTATQTHRTTTVRVGENNTMSMHVMKRVKIVVRCPAVFHEFGQHFFPPLGGSGGETMAAVAAAAAANAHWISRINAWGALMLKRVVIQAVDGSVLMDASAEFAMVRKYCIQKESVCAELLGKMPLMQEIDTLQIESGQDVEFVYDADLPCSRHPDNLFPVCLLPQGFVAQLEWRRQGEMFITSDGDEYGAPRPFVIDAQTGRLRPLEQRDLVATLEVQCHRIDEAQVTDLRTRASGAHGLNYKVVQAMLVGEKVVLLQNDPSEPRERLQQAARDAQDLLAFSSSSSTEQQVDFSATSVGARTHDILLEPSVGLCRGYITSYQLLHHRLRKNWLLYSGAIVGDPAPNEVPTRTDPIDAIGLVLDGTVWGGELVSAERARTEGFADHSAQQIHTNGFFYPILFADDWDGYDFDISLPHAPQQKRAVRIVRRAGTPSGVVRVWGLFEDKITFQLTPQGVMTVRSCFAYKGNPQQQRK